MSNHTISLQKECQLEQALEKYNNVKIVNVPNIVTYEQNNPYSIFQSKELKQAIKNNVLKKYNEKMDKLKENSEYFDEEKRFLGPYYLEHEYLLRLEKGDDKIKFQSWSLLDLIGRMNSYTPYKWKLYKNILTIPLCASYGWINSNKEELTCSFCNAVVKVDQIDEIDVDKVLKDTHLYDCPWKNIRCKKELYKMHILPIKMYLKTLKQHMEILKPYIEKFKINLIYNYDTNILSKIVEGLNKELKMEIDAKLLLFGLSGWYPTPNKDINTTPLHCWMCNRKLGLWNFDQKNNKKRGPKVKDNKPDLNLKLQHKEFCPILGQNDNLDFSDYWIQLLTQRYSETNKVEVDIEQKKELFKRVHKRMLNFVSEDIKHGVPFKINKVKQVDVKQLRDKITNTFDLLRKQYHSQFDSVLNEKE